MVFTSQIIIVSLVRTLRYLNHNPLLALCSQLTLGSWLPWSQRWPAIHWWAQPIPLLPTAHTALMATTQQISSIPLRPAWLQRRVIQPLSLIIHHKLRCGQVLHLMVQLTHLWSHLFQWPHAVRNTLFLSKGDLESTANDLQAKVEGVSTPKREVIFGFVKSNLFRKCFKKV